MKVTTKCHEECVCVCVCVCVRSVIINQLTKFMVIGQQFAVPFSIDALRFILIVTILFFIYYVLFFYFIIIILFKKIFEMALSISVAFTQLGIAIVK